MQLDTSTMAQPFTGSVAARQTAAVACAAYKCYTAEEEHNYIGVVFRDDKQDVGIWVGGSSIVRRCIVGHGVVLFFAEYCLKMLGFCFLVPCIHDRAAKEMGCLWAFVRQAGKYSY